MLSLIANYFYTGLIEVVKIDIFWNFANKEYFINKFGYAVIEYSKIANDCFLQRIGFFEWTRFIILEHSWEFITLLSTLIYTILILISILLKKIKNKNLNYFLIIFLLFSLVTLFFSFLIQQPSIIRVYIFINAFIYLPLCILIPIYFIQYQEIKIINISKNLIAIILYIPAFLSMFYIYLNYSNIVKSLYIQNNSLSNTYNTSIKNQQSKDLYNFTLEIRNDLPNEKIMLLSTVGGPGIFLPRPGLLMGPSRALGMEWDLINKSQEVKQIREILEKENINFFIIDLDKTLWGNLVISKMFENDHLVENLKIIKNYENMYLLTWKNKNEINKISQEFLTILDLKRSRIINSIFSNNFKKNYLENTNDINVFYKNLNIIKEDCLKNSFNKNLIHMILNDIKKSNILINDIDDKIDNIRIITKKILLEKYEKLYFLNIDIKDSTPFEKIYLKNHENNSCKFNY